MMVGAAVSCAAPAPIERQGPIFRPVSYDEAMNAIEEEPPRGTIGLQHCPGDPFESTHFGPWNNGKAQELAHTRSPQHSANDVITTVGSPIRLQARVGYGEERVSLEHEWVRIFLGKCSGWRQVGHQRTGESGEVNLPLGERLVVGVYEAAFQVVGDLSYTTAKIWVVPANTPVVVFNVMGTLVPAHATASQGDVVRAPFPGAVELTHAYAEHGYLVTYLLEESSGVDVLANARQWLDQQGFSDGAIILEGQGAALAVEQSHPIDFRADGLQSIREAGLWVEAAYGSAITDIEVYRQAGLGPERIWVMAAAENTRHANVVRDSWESHAQDVVLLPLRVE